MGLAMLSIMTLRRPDHTDGAQPQEVRSEWKRCLTAPSPSNPDLSRRRRMHHERPRTYDAGISHRIGRYSDAIRVSAGKN